MIGVTVAIVVVEAVCIRTTTMLFYCEFSRNMLDS